jgi:phage protein D
MATAAMLKVHTGAFRILKNGSALPPALLASIRNLQVQDEINVPAMFSFTLDIGAPEGRGQIDFDTFQPGDRIDILLGLDKLDKLITGDVTAVEPRFNAYATATVRGFDRMYRLRFGTRTATYLDQDDNQIVRQVAASSGLQARLDGNPGTVNRYVLQNNRTNYDFLLSRCKQLNYELTMDQATLVFRPSAEGASPTRKLAWPADVEEVDLRMKVPTLGDKVTVVSYDLASNKVISAEASSGAPRDKMGGTETGYQAARAFPDSAITLERPNITSVEALQEVAKAQYESHLASFIEGSASLRGDPGLKAGVNIRLSGLGKRFDGIYYVTSSTHSYDDSTGYRTSIEIRRSGA